MMLSCSSILLTLTHASFLNTPKSMQLKCDQACMNYCVAYYPTSGCLEVCGCEQTELGRVMYQRPSLKLVATPAAPVYDPTLTPTPPSNSTPEEILQLCIATCGGEKCRSEIVEKKEACVNLCVKQCQASYDYTIKQREKERLEEEQKRNKTQNQTQNATQNETGNSNTTQNTTQQNTTNQNVTDNKNITQNTTDETQNNTNNSNQTIGGNITQN